jgi:hypothetical protein
MMAQTAGKPRQTRGGTRAALGPIVALTLLAALPALGGSITGKVKDASTGAVLSGVTVKVTQQTSRTATTNSSGVYTITSVSSGTKTVTASKTGYVTTVSGSVTVPSSGTVTAPDILLPRPGTVTGKIVSSVSGSAVSSATVKLTGTSTSTTTSSTGTYSLSAAAGTYTLTITKTGWVTQESGAFSITVGQTTTLGDISLTPFGTITGSVVNASSGAAVSSATVKVTGTSTSVTTGTSGTFNLSAAPGTVTLTVSKTGYLTTTTGDITVTAGQTTAAGAIALTQTATVTGTVKNAATSANISGATVSVHGMPAITTSTNTYGKYTLSGVPLGSQSLDVSKAGFSSLTTAPFTVVAGTNTRPNILLSAATGTIAGTVADAQANNAPLSGATITVNSVTPTISGTSGADGSFTLASVPTGSRTLTVTKSSYSSATTSAVTVVDGGTVSVGTAALNRTTVTVSGTVKTASGTAISGATVSVVEQSGKSTTTSSTGAYTLSGVYWGAVTMQAVKSGYSTKTVPLTLVAGTNATCNITLTAGEGTIEGAVRDAGTGFGLAGLTVRLSDISGYTATSDSDGLYVLGSVPVGAHTVTTSASGYTTPAGVAVTVVANTTVTAPVLSLEPTASSLQGTVLDASGGAGIAGMTVTATRTGQTVTTDSAGTFNLGSVPAGYEILVFSKSGYTTYSTPPIALDSSVGMSYTMYLSSGEYSGAGTIRGVVRGSSGEPVAGAAVSVPGAGSATTGADGTYSIAAQPGRYAIAVSKSGYRSVVEPLAGDGPIEAALHGWENWVVQQSIVLPLQGETGELHLSTTDPLPRTATGGSVRLYAPYGVYKLTTSTSGYRTIAGVGAGPLFAGGRSKWLAPGGSADFDLPVVVTLPSATPKWAAAGVVYSAITGAPVPNATVTLANSGQSFSTTATTDANGRWSFASGPLGSYSVTASADPGLTSEATWRFTAQDNSVVSSRDIALVAADGGTLTIDEPIAGSTLIEDLTRVACSAALPRPDDGIIAARVSFSGGGLSAGSLTLTDANHFSFDVVGTSNNGPLTVTVNALTRYGQQIEANAEITVQKTIGIKSLSLTPADIFETQPVQGTVTLNMHASEAFVVALTSSNEAAATVPATVTVPAGSTSVSFPVTSLAVADITTVTIAASGGPVSRSAELHITPLSQAQQIPVGPLQLTPTAVVGGLPASLTITITSAASAPGAVVYLSSSDPSRATLPAFVIVPAGATQTTVAIGTVLVASSATVQITATAASTTETATLTLNPYAIVSIAVDQDCVGGVDPGCLAEIFINAPAPQGDLPIQLTASPAGVVELFGQPKVMAGSSRASHALTGYPVYHPETALLTARLGESSASTSVTVVPEYLVTASVLPPSIACGESAIVELVLKGWPVAGIAYASFSSSNPAAATVPSGTVESRDGDDTQLGGVSYFNFPVVQAPTNCSAGSSTISVTYRDNTRPLALNVTLPTTGSVHGRILAAALTPGGDTPPIEGATITLTGTTKSTTTDANGYFLLWHADGTYTVTVSKQGYGSSTSAPFAMTTGQVTEIGDLFLTTMATIRGKVTTDTGYPMGFLYIYTEGAPYQCFSKDTGDFELSVLAGTYTLVFKEDSFGILKYGPVTVVAGQDVTLPTIVLHSSGTINGTVTVAKSDGSGYWYLRDVAVSVVETGRDCTTNYMGEYTIRDGPGSLTLRVQKAGYVTQEIPFTIESNATRTIDVLLLVTPGLGLGPLTADSYYVISGHTLTAIVRLNGPAPEGGATVGLRILNSAAATVPSTLVIPAGQTSGTVTITAKKVSTIVETKIEATYGPYPVAKRTRPFYVDPWQLEGTSPGWVLPGASNLVTYGCGFDEGSTLRLRGPVYALSDLATPLCDLATCPTVSIPITAGNAGQVASWAVPGETAPGIYHLVAYRADANMESINGHWLAVDEPSKVCPVVPAAEHLMAKSLVSGQTVTGTFAAAGDPSGRLSDYNAYYFVATAGSRIEVSLDRVDTSKTWEHPDTVDPEIEIVAPDGFVYQNLLSLDNRPGVDLNASLHDAVLPQTGVYVLFAQTTRGAGDYRLHFAITSAAATIEPTFAVISANTTTVAVGATVATRLLALDWRGWPLSGARAAVTAYSGGSGGSVSFPNGSGGTTGVNGIFSVPATASTAGMVALDPALYASNQPLANARQQEDGGERRSDDVDDAQAPVVRPIPRYHAVAAHPITLGSIEPDGTMSIVGGEYTRTPRLVPAFREARTPSPNRRDSLASDQASPASRDAVAPRPTVLDASTAVPIAPDPADPELAGSYTSCGWEEVVLSIAPVGTVIKPPFTVTLTDLTPKAGEADPAGEVGPDGIEGHRVGKTIQLKLAVKDADGNEPTYPVAIHLAVGGSRHGTLIISGANGTVECDTASFIWHQRDAQGTLINLNDQLGYRLGTLAWIAGFVSDPAKPGGIAPVWTSAETLRITALGIESGGSQDQLTEQTIAVRPEAAKPDHLACWDVYPSEPCSNAFQYWTGYWSYADGMKSIGNPLETKLRVGPMQLYNAYFLYDSYGNLTYAPSATTSATQPAPNVSVGFANQIETGPDFAGTMLATSWHNDPEMPQGQMTSTLTVSYPTDAGPTPDWQAGTVTKAITYQFDVDSTKLLAQKQSYESRLGMEDGAFPLEVSPEAGSGGMPTTAAGDTPRLVLLALSGTLVKTELLEGAVEPSLEPQKVWRKDGAIWAYTDDQDQSTVIETSDQPTFRLSLVDGDGEVVPEGELQAHLCPRYEHFTDGPPAPGSCTASPIAAPPGTGRIDSLTLNQPGAQRGYLGIELTKAPPQPGEYYIKVESLGPSLYRMRRQGQLTLDTHAQGEHVGYFAACIVSGVELLDSSFQRVNPMEITVPTNGYARVLTARETGQSINRLIRIERQNGAVVTPDTPLTLDRVGASGTYLAPITLVPEGQSPPAPPAGVANAAAPPNLVIGLGANQAVISTTQGQPQGRCGVDYPAKLRFRFVKRDGSSLTDTPDPARPELAGTMQETEIGDASDNYAEIIKLEIQAVDPNNGTIACTGCAGVQVGIAENLNGFFDGGFDAFFDGTRGSSKLETNGKIDRGSFPLGAQGTVRVTLKSVLLAREKAGIPWPKVIPGVSTPDGTFSGRAFYWAEKGPLLMAQVVSGGRRTVTRNTTPQTDTPLGLWVDERSYAHARGQTAGVWASSGNALRDWFEKHLRYEYATWTGNAEIVQGMSRLGSLLEQTVIPDPDPAHVGQYLRCPFVAETRPLPPEPPQSEELTWNLTSFATRALPNQDEIAGRHFDEAGLSLACPADPFRMTAVHEARHIWQKTLTAANGQPDPDKDFLYLSPPASATILTDDRYAFRNRGTNPEFDFWEDHIIDFTEWGGYSSGATAAAMEADAMRVAGPLAGVTPACAVGYSIDLSAVPLAGVGWKLIADVKWKNHAGQFQPYEGVTVTFERVSGNLELSEDIGDGDMTPPLSFWTKPPAEDPLLTDKGVADVLRLGMDHAVARARFAPLSRLVTDARVSLRRPTQGTPTQTTIRATLIRPKNECSGANPTDETTVTP